MASINKIGSSWRALVRKGGHSRCKTFSTQAAAKSWARTVESEIEELKATGRMQPRGITIAHLIDRYEREIYAVKPWGRSKTADLKRLKTGLGNTLAADLDYKNLFDHFMSLRERGAGGVVIGSLVGYLITVLETASTVWRLAVPVDVAKDVRGSLKKLGMVTKSKPRNRRVLDAEVAKIVEHLQRKVSAMPLTEIIWFCVATSMRISEVCRIQWEDLNEADRTILIRDRKHPSAKIGNHQTVPLLKVGALDAFEIVMKLKPLPTPGQEQKLPKYIFRANEKTVSSYFTEAVQQLELKDLHLHDLRHEGISRLFEAGYRIEQVSLVSGHRDWSQLKRYTHIQARDLHRKPEPVPA